MGIVKEKEASDVLEAALKQMDGIISGTSFVLFPLPVFSLLAFSSVKHPFSTIAIPPPPSNVNHFVFHSFPPTSK